MNRRNILPNKNKNRSDFSNRLYDLCLCNHLNILIRQSPSDFNPFRKVPKPFRNMNREERAEAIARDPDYGQIICRCEQVTLAEVLRAIDGPLGARSVSGVKMRVRAGMGRCQGGFCSPEVVRILSERLGLPMTEVLQAGAGSEMLLDEVCVPHGREELS